MAFVSTNARAAKQVPESSHALGVQASMVCGITCNPVRGFEVLSVSEPGAAWQWVDDSDAFVPRRRRRKRHKRKLVAEDLSWYQPCDMEARVANPQSLFPRRSVACHTTRNLHDLARVVLMCLVHFSVLETSLPAPDPTGIPEQLGTPLVVPPVVPWEDYGLLFDVCSSEACVVRNPGHVPARAIAQGDGPFIRPPSWAVLVAVASTGLNLTDIVKVPEAQLTVDQLGALLCTLYSVDAQPFYSSNPCGSVSSSCGGLAAFNALELLAVELSVRPVDNGFPTGEVWSDASTLYSVQIPADTDRDACTCTFGAHCGSTNASNASCTAFSSSYVDRGATFDASCRGCSQVKLGADVLGCYGGAGGLSVSACTAFPSGYVVRDATHAVPCTGGCQDELVTSALSCPFGLAVASRTDFPSGHLVRGASTLVVPSRGLGSAASIGPGIDGGVVIASSTDTISCLCDRGVVSDPAFNCEGSCGLVNDALATAHTVCGGAKGVSCVVNDCQGFAWSGSGDLRAPTVCPWFDCDEIPSAVVDYSAATELVCCMTEDTHGGVTAAVGGNQTSPFATFLPHGPSAVVPSAAYARTEHGWIIGNHPDFGVEHIEELKRVLVEHKHCFAYSMADLPGYQGSVGPYTITLKPECVGKPIWTKQHPHSVAELGVQDEKCEELLGVGIIIPCKATMYASDVVIAAKKDAITGEWTDKRFCQNFRPLNASMEVDKYRLPLADEIFDAVGDCSCFSKIDLRSGFYQLPIHPDHQKYTAFWWRGKLFQFTRMPFGLHNAPQRWQQLMDVELAAGGCSGFARAFVDDILVFSQSPAEHVGHVAKVLQCLNAVGIKAHPDKCLFGCDTVEYLGFNVSKYGLTPHEAKVAAIAALRAPTCVSEVRSVLGLLSYYRRFVPSFSALAEPLNALLRKSVQFSWGPEQQAALDELKRILMTEGLALKRVDPEAPLLLYCDWSKQGVGAVLAQVDAEGREHICACISRSLNVHEKNYVSFKGELLACVWACQTLRQYLHGRRFTLVTDHEPLIWLVNKKDLTGQYGRWAVILSDYEFDIVHRQGAAHLNADILSRMPRSTDQDVSGARLDVDTENEPQPLAALCSVLASSATCLSWGLQHSAEDMVDPDSCVCFSTMLTSQQASNIVLCSKAAKARHACCVNHHCMAAANVSTVEDYMADVSDLLVAHMGSVADSGERVPESNSAVGEQRIQRLQAQASHWHATVASSLPSVTADAPHYHAWRPACVVTKGGESAAKADKHRVRHTASLCTHVVGAGFFANASADGVVVLELFGGICSGLEMVLRSGIRVLRYLYCDIDPVARRVAAHRLHSLSEQYPLLLPPTSFADAFTALPQDVWKVGSSQLISAGVTEGHQWLVVAGWECSDLSPAGQGKGLSGNHSNTFFALRSVLGAIQQLQQRKPPGYLLENTYLEFDFGKVARVISQDRDLIYSSFGRPVVCDAVQFGSYAHRLRHYWTNLAAVEPLQHCIKGVRRPPGLKVTDVLLPGRYAMPVTQSDRAPFYACNEDGEPRGAFPTFVTVMGSRGFKVGAPGAVYDSSLRQWTEPCPDEREVCMGLDMGCTFVPDWPGQPQVTTKARHVLTGRAMDQNAVSSLFAICKRLSLIPIGSATGSNSPVASAPAPTLPCALVPGGGSTSSVFVIDALHDSLVNCKSELSCQPHGACAATTEALFVMACTEEEACMDKSGSAAQRRDVWLDPLLLGYLFDGVLTTGLPAAHIRRLQRRAAGYRVGADSILFKRMPDGTSRVVPRPEHRAALVKDVHERCGHFGEKRTIHLLLSQFWWHGLYNDVYAVCRSCSLCRRVNASFNARSVELQPLPIMGLFYRWGVDLCGDFVKTKRGNTYVMICVEYFSKHIELIPLPDKKPDTTSHAFLCHVLSRFGSCAEVLSDQGTEWRGSFDSLLESCFIDHRVTAPNHPQADGLTERVVQTVKRALRKFVESVADIYSWDEGLPWIALGYRCSPQASTGYSPYELLYARRPVVPPAVVQVVSQPVDFDCADTAAASLLQRAHKVKQMCPEAFGNLLIAQHKDGLRYAMVRSGSFKPTLVKFFPGQFVYVQRPTVANTLMVRARPEILRVVAVNPGGAVTLQGKCGTTVQQNVENLAPCFLAGIDATIDPTLAVPSADLPCEVCRFPHKPGRMLLCDNCNTGWHLECLTPKLASVPEGVWACPYCVAAGVDIAALEARQAANQQRQQNAHVDVAPMFAKNRRRLLVEAEALHGRWLVYPLPGPGRTKVPTWGLVEFVGQQAYPRCLRVHYPGGRNCDVTLRGVRAYLQGVNSFPPDTVVASVPALQPSHATCTSISPASPPIEFSLASCIAAVEGSLTSGTGQHVCDSDVQALATVLNFGLVSTVCDPVGSGLLQSASALSSNYSQLYLAESVGSAALLGDPAWWQQSLRQHGQPDVVICGGNPAELLIALPTMASFVGLVCVKVPAEALHNLTTSFAAYLQQLQAQQRMQVVHGVMVGQHNTPQCCTWLCVFASASMRMCLLQPQYRSSSYLTYVACKE